MVLVQSDKTKAASQDPVGSSQTHAKHSAIAFLHMDMLAYVEDSYKRLSTASHVKTYI